MSKRKRNTAVRVRDKPTVTNSSPEARYMGNPPKYSTDAFSNPLARLGYGTPNLLEYTEYSKTNFTAEYNTLTALYRENWIVKRIVDVVAEDMTKNWYSIKSQISPESKKQIARLEARTAVRAKVLEGLKWGRLYGGAAAVIVIEGQEDMLDQPLNYDLIMPGSFKGLIIVDRWSGISPSAELVENINDPDFGLPKYYTVADESFGFGVKVHHSRIIRFVGRPLPNIEEQSEQYWGTSELEHVYAELKKYDNTSYNIAALVFSANLKVYQMDGFDQLGTLNPSAMQDLYQTLTLMNWMRSSQGMQIIGPKDVFSTHQYSFSGLSDIYEMFMLDISGAAAIPVTKLFGRSPAGMNATGESDMANYYDSIEEQQEATLRPMLDRLLPIMCISEFGAIPDDLEFEFEPVRRPSEEEKKNILTQTTTAIVSTFQAGIISQQIALKELRESVRTTGMWNNITDEDIENADSDFGIGGEPPDIMAVAGRQEKEEQDNFYVDRLTNINDDGIINTGLNETDGGPGSGRKPEDGGNKKTGGSGKRRKGTKYAPSPRRNFGGVTVSPKKYAKLCGELNTRYPNLKEGEHKTINDNQYRYDVTADGFGGMIINKRIKLTNGRKR